MYAFSADHLNMMTLVFQLKHSRIILQFSHLGICVPKAIQFRTKIIHSFILKWSKMANTKWSEHTKSPKNEKSPNVARDGYIPFTSQRANVQIRNRSPNPIYERTFGVSTKLERTSNGKMAAAGARKPLLLVKSKH